MKIVITGGNGFIGGRLARSLLERGSVVGTSGTTEPIDVISLVDLHNPASPDDDRRIERVSADVADRVAVEKLIDDDDVSIFHLGAMVSAGCEADFDGAMRVNVAGTKNILDGARERSGLPRVVFASSIAAFGGEAVADAVTDSTKLTPETTYGTTKAIGELLVNDYTRKGYVDGRSARLPTVIIRPGKPNAAASSWVSGIFREPLNGQGMDVPVADDIRVPVTGIDNLVDNLVRLYEVDGQKLGADRAVNLPAIAPTVKDMVAALRLVAGSGVERHVSFQHDDLVSRMFATWAQTSRFERALELGMTVDVSVASIIRQYLSDRA